MRFIRGVVGGVHGFVAGVSTVCALAIGFVALFFTATPKMFDGGLSEHGVAHADAPACGGGGGDAGSCTGGCGDASGSGCSDGGGGCGSG